MFRALHEGPEESLERCDPSLHKAWPAGDCDTQITEAGPAEAVWHPTQVQRLRSSLGCQEAAASKLGSKAQWTFSMEKEEEGGNIICRSKDGRRPAVCWGIEEQLLKEGGWEADRRRLVCQGTPWCLVLSVYEMSGRSGSPQRR